MSINATELFIYMDRAIHCCGHLRVCGDPQSPAQQQTVEAAPYQQFTLIGGAYNVPAQRRLNYAWAVANVLHFFAATEDARMLARYNKHAERFAPGGKWVGAYGALAVPQLKECAAKLQRSRSTRRAFVTMNSMFPEDINRPSCWNMLQFLIRGDCLHMHVTQRSLHLYRVMAYDCVLLTNVLEWTRHQLECKQSVLHWTVGSLHRDLDDGFPAGGAADTLYLPADVLSDPLECLKWLNCPESAPPEWAQILGGPQ